MIAGTKASTNEQASKLPAKAERQEPLYSLRTAMNSLFDNFMVGFPGTNRFDWEAVFVPQVNVAETETALVVTMEMPGMDAKDIEVNIVGDNIVVSGHKKEEKEEKTVGYHSYERRFGSFERTLRLPCEVEREKIEAHHKNGVLQVTLPKSKSAQAASRKIEVKKA